MDTEKFRKFAKLYQICSGVCCPRVLSLHLDKMPSWETHPKLLNIGAGVGSHTEKLRMLGHTVEEIDIDAKNGMKFGDMHELDYPNASFDILFMSQVFEHSIAPLIAIYEFNRVLRMEGVVFLTVPANAPQWVNDNEHHFCVPRENITAMFQKCGFMEVYFAEDKENPNGGDEQKMWTIIFRKIREVGI